MSPFLQAAMYACIAAFVAVVIIAAVGKLGRIKGTHPKTSKDTNKRKRKSPAPEIPVRWKGGHDR